jgi:S1-C subfamily serine protease/predicted esterase
MLSLLKTEATGLPVPTAMPESEIRIGQWAVAVGRTLDPNPDHFPSVSVGIVSALNRIWGRCLQTDAKISPVNYGGPLVAADGRVIGLLIPASPVGDGEAAGFEWYDSGIGFAVPFAHVLKVLPRLREGKDLRRGLLGITPKGSDQFSVALTINTVTPDSVAAKAGIKPGDVVIAVDGQPVANQAQAYHILGPKYEGDAVAIKVKRGEEELTFSDLKLMGSVPPYRHPFIGFLPLRDDPELGVGVRFVYADSPAATAGLEVGDRVMKIKMPNARQATAFSGRDQLRELLDTIPAGSEVELTVKKKDDSTKTMKLTLAALPDDAPKEVPLESTLRLALTPRKQPPAESLPGLPDLLKGKGKGNEKKAPPAKDKETEERPDPNRKVETGLLNRTSPARDREYWLYVPPNYDPNVSHGIVVWLHAAGQGGRDAKDVAGIWQLVCAEQHLIIVGPKSANDAGWLPSEAEFIQETLREVMSQYTIDRQRVVMHGLGVGGQMAFYVGFNARDLTRGVATSGAVLGSPAKDNVAGQRLSFFIVAGGKDPLAKEIAEMKPLLSEKRFPVQFREVPDMGKEYLDRPTFDELTRWIDSLDRL